MSYFQDVQIALDTKLNSLAGGVAIAWENTKYVPVIGTPFMRPTVLLAGAELMDLNDLQLNTGIYQIDIFYPKEAGPGAVLAQADAVYDHFKSGTKLTANSVDVHIKQIDISSREVEESWYRISVDVNFKTYAS